MTTIAWRGDILAADTRLVWDDMVFRCNKLHKVGSECLGIAGDSDAEWHFLRWYKAGQKHDEWKLEDWKDREFEALVLDEYGDCYAYFGDQCRIPIEHDFIAIGSGGKLAVGFMHTGMSAIQAVKMAGELDVNTNSVVDWFNCNTGKIKRGSDVKKAV